MKQFSVNMFKKVSPQKNFAGLVGLGNVAKSRADKQIVIEELKEREIIRVHGEEAVPFLQGLITNDMKQLLNGRISGHGFPSMYAMFLNKFGRMLYETVIYRTRDPLTFLLECDKEIAHELKRHLQIYRVRRTVDIDSMENNYKPWVVFDPEAVGGGVVTAKRLGEESIYAQDPRIRGLGWRLLTATERSFGDVARAFAVPGEIGILGPTMNNNYRYHRYRFGVGEGAIDFPPGKFLPLEINGDLLNAINFHKGCYIGQELTSRVFHTEVVRNRLMPIMLTATPRGETVIQSDLCLNIGNLCGVCNDRGLALLNVEQVFRASRFQIDGEICFVKKPKWWPMELVFEARANIAERVQ